METLTLAQVGLGPWGSNLARNFNELVHLKWICDVDSGAQARVGSRVSLDDADGEPRRSPRR